MKRPMWATRRARAARLLREAPHAEEMLVFYVGLTEIQERIAARVPVDEWLEVVRTSPEGSPPIHLGLLPPAELLPPFEMFLEWVVESGTAVMAERADQLLAGDSSVKATALAGMDGFHARAFLEPVATTLASAYREPDGAGDPGRCLLCGSRPVVGVLRDQPDALGSRSLVCSLCATEWRIDRLTCPCCGEREADRLQFHVAESVSHVRVDECDTCGRYMKTVDLRERGDAVPVVDELATIELDLWARERGLEKVQQNLLGL